jgi:hypothetical protein
MFTPRQLREAFPWETAPRYLLRDRDRVFGQDFVEQVKAIGIKQVVVRKNSIKPRNQCDSCETIWTCNVCFGSSQSLFAW